MTPMFLIYRQPECKPHPSPTQEQSTKSHFPQACHQALSFLCTALRNLLTVQEKLPGYHIIFSHSQISQCNILFASKNETPRKFREGPELWDSLHNEHDWLCYFIRKELSPKNLYHLNGFLHKKLSNPKPCCRSSFHSDPILHVPQGQFLIKI